MLYIIKYFHNNISLLYIYIYICSSCHTDYPVFGVELFSAYEIGVIDVKLYELQAKKVCFRSYIWTVCVDSDRYAL